MTFTSRIAGALVACALSITAVQAQSLQDGIDAWLADDDATALPILSDLANAGDVDAQMLLGQIEAVAPPGAGSEFLANLNRRERIALLRSEGGLSGTSWTRVQERDGNPLAAALMEARLPDATLETASFLVQEGEVQAGTALAWQVFDRGRWNEIFALTPDDPLLGELDFVSWSRSYFGAPPGPDAWAWLTDTPATGRTGGMMMVSLVAPVLAPHLRPSEQLRDYIQAMRGTPEFLVDNGDIVDAAAVMERQLPLDSNLATVNAYCSSTCPDQVGLCGMAVIAATGGADRIKLHDTPYEALISQEQFAQSPRAVGELRRWMASLQSSAEMQGRVVLSQCVNEDIASITVE
ncbi:hypothetical protein [Pontivivens insulae]|uniref:Uncharacterized protein n=1 Tax=Pontivivens insulae TaxID=1639689 RepID=A0A2R8A9B9_9RHOB|nr:hypothetical protein [Pontivivens insulae]RED18752.1 hypothetical protein DFR53_0951 [Pontivivens insulae]SPF28650.1 hypothetical protein POI8812_00952 [Pontivivens insulae]